MTIEIHPNTSDPTAAWKELSKTQRVIKITMKPPNPEIPKNKVRVVCMSDTHSLTPHIKFDIPDGNLLSHCNRTNSILSLMCFIQFR